MNLYKQFLFIFGSYDACISTHKIISHFKYGCIPRAAAAERIFSVIDKPIQIKEEENLPDLIIKNSLINFRNVHFNYKTSKEKAINDISFTIDGGKITALVGKSGAGKSTIINLIPRFYDPQDGKFS